MHDRVKRFQCHICQKYFSRKMPRDIHIETVHEKLKMYKCDICRQVFGTLNHMKKHQARIHVEDDDED
jgi:hypothetical protein